MLRAFGITLIIVSGRFIGILGVAVRCGVTTETARSASVPRNRVISVSNTVLDKPKRLLPHFMLPTSYVAENKPAMKEASVLKGVAMLNLFSWNSATARRSDAPTKICGTIYVCVIAACIMTSSRPSYLIAADRLPERVKAAVLSPQMFSPSLGLNRREVLHLAGKPFESVMLPSGIESLRFKSASARCYVEISPTTGKVVQVYYFKTAPFTAKEKEELLARNSKSSSAKFSSRESSLETKEYGKEFLLAVLVDTKRDR
jgi:hypothetical protein